MIDKVTIENKALDSLMVIAQQAQMRLDSIQKVQDSKIKTITADKNLSTLISQVKDDVFFIRTTRVIVTDGQDGWKFQIMDGMVRAS